MIVVDDGIATGGTMKAALRGANKNQPSWLILAVPVAPPEVARDLGHECDEVIWFLNEAHGFGLRIANSAGP